MRIHTHTHTQTPQALSFATSRDYQMVRLQASRWCGRDLASNRGRASSAKNLTESRNRMEREPRGKRGRDRDRGRETEHRNKSSDSHVGFSWGLETPVGLHAQAGDAPPPPKARQAQCSALLQGYHFRKSRWKLHRGKQDSERSTLAKLQQRRSLKRGAGKSSLLKVLLL